MSPVEHEHPSSENAELRRPRLTPGELASGDNSSIQGGMGTIVEIDTRTIHGPGGEICWELWDGRHVITVYDDRGKVRARLRARDGDVARELFEHPFARSAVPNLFPAPS